MRYVLVVGLVLALAACGSDKKAEQKKLDEQHAQQVQSLCQNVGAANTPQNAACAALYNQYSPPPQMK